MSSHETIQVTCPKCQQVQPFENWHSVNVTLHPELRERVLAGDLFTLACTKCGQETTVEKALLYNDMERHFMVCLSRDEPPMSPQADSEELTEVRLRWVQTPAQLSEKIRIFEDGLDDRLVEIQKILVDDMLQEELREKPIALLYDGLKDHPKDGRQIDFVVFLKKSVRKVSFNYAEMYEDGLRMLNALVPQRVEKPGCWTKVDPAGTRAWLASLENSEAGGQEQTT